MAATVKCQSCGRSNRVQPTASGVPRCGVCHQQLAWIVDADQRSFEAETTASVPVLIDFWAPWCGPCRMISPLVERIARAHAGHLKVVKLNIDEAPQVADRYRVQGIPLLVLLRDGAERDRLVGAVPEPQLRGWVERHMAPVGRAQAG